MVELRQLICEGACNRGLVALYDQEIDASGRLIPRDPRQAIRDELLFMLRKLRHTLHAPVISRSSRWVCSECGTVRDY